MILPEESGLLLPALALDREECLTTAFHMSNARRKGNERSAADGDLPRRVDINCGLVVTR
jgi:hypothetical protein